MFANMLVVGVVVEGTDVPELAGLFRSEANDPVAGCVVTVFAVGCPPRLNKDFEGSFCCWAVTFPCALFTLLKRPLAG